MLPVRFGAGDRQLLGMFHPAQPERGSACSVLICPAFGQESIRTHRLFKVLAERLAREGANVLRFDYFGTGDSPGNDDQIDIDRWIADIHCAQDELNKRCDARIVWVGARLGATVAALASRAGIPPYRLVLWEPILSGSDYLQSLAHRHIEHLVATLGHARGAALDVVKGREALGFALPDHWVRQVESITAQSLQGARADQIMLVGGREMIAAAAQVLQRDGKQQLTAHEFATPFDWSSEEALNSALVPAPAVQLMFTLARLAT